MAGIMGDAYGVGLAAPQLGLSQRLLVYRVGPDAPLVALANPELEWASDDQETLDEGCLSIPGITVDVERPVHVRVRALDEEGETRMVEASGLEARVIQHEMDHLNGVLILDRTTRDERKRALRELREAERAASASRRPSCRAGRTALPALTAALKGGHRGAERSQIATNADLLGLSSVLQAQQLLVRRQGEEFDEVLAQCDAFEE